MLENNNEPIEKLFDDCNSLTDVYMLSKTLKASNSNPDFVRMVNSEVSRAKKRLVMQAAPVDLLHKVLPRASTSQKGLQSAIVVDLQNPKASKIIMRRDNTFFVK